MDRPLVAITVGSSTNPLPYSRAIEMAGGQAIVLKPDHGIASLPANAAGIVFAGGAAVHPSRYGQEFDPAIRRSVEEERDELEWLMMEAALERGIPILGICRGLQMINVYFGGTLCQNLSAGDRRDNHRPDLGRGEPAHLVVARSGQHRAIFGTRPFWVNSIHRQGVETLSPNLAATVFTEDGLIEGYEDASKGILAVQWHPEELVDRHPEQLALFKNFLAKVSEQGASDH